MDDIFEFEIDDSYFESTEEDSDYGFSVNSLFEEDGLDDDYNFEEIDETNEQPNMSLPVESNYGEQNLGNGEIEDSNRHEHLHRPISFTGVGRCECGCGSFGGNGSICKYCGHPWSSHSRYKS